MNTGKGKVEKVYLIIYLKKKKKRTKDNQWLVKTSNAQQS